MAAFSITQKIAGADESGHTYPEEVMQEYHTLTDKKLLRTITEAEAKRLFVVRAIIAQIDAEQDGADARDMQAAKLRQELSELRAEVEALPDAAHER